MNFWKLRESLLADCVSCRRAGWPVIANALSEHSGKSRGQEVAGGSYEYRRPFHISYASQQLLYEMETNEMIPLSKRWDLSNGLYTR